MINSDGMLDDKRVAILATDGFEESELMDPCEALESAGAEVELVSLKSGRIKSWKDKNWGDQIEVDVALSDAMNKEYDALLLPGGVINSDMLRKEPMAVQFVKKFVDTGKPIAAICHAPWILIEAGCVKGHRLTSWPSLKTDLINAGGDWVDEEVVTDNGLVTSRKPDDIPAFNEKMIEEFAEGQHLPHNRRELDDQEESALGA